MKQGYRIKFGTDLKTQFVAKVQRLDEKQPESAETAVSKADCIMLMHAFASALSMGTLLPSLAGTPHPYIPCAVEDGTGNLMVTVRNLQDGTDTTLTLQLNAATLPWKPTNAATTPGNAPGSSLLN